MRKLPWKPDHMTRLTIALYVDVQHVYRKTVVHPPGGVGTLVQVLLCSRTVYIIQPNHTRCKTKVREKQCPSPLEPQLCAHHTCSCISEGFLAHCPPNSIKVNLQNPGRLVWPVHQPHVKVLWSSCIA